MSGSFEEVEETRNPKFLGWREITLLEYTFYKFVKGSIRFEKTINQKFPGWREITLLRYKFGNFIKGSILATLNTLEIKKILAGPRLHSWNTYF